MVLSQNDVLFEDNHLIAIHKKVGELSQGDKTGDLSIIDDLKAFLKLKYQKTGNVYVGSLHRLDRPVQGVLLFAKTSKAAERMSKAFKEKRIEKTYHAIIEGKLSLNKGIVKSYLKKDRTNNLVTSHATMVSESKLAETEFSVVKENNGKTLIELKPLTGRSHQLRVHCAFELKTPIIGDVKYGSKDKTKDRSLYLLAHSIGFIHPVSKEPITIRCNYPTTGLWKLIDYKQNNL